LLNVVKQLFLWEKVEATLSLRPSLLKKYQKISKNIKKKLKKKKQKLKKNRTSYNINEDIKHYLKEMLKIHYLKQEKEQ
jgi:hypothetical protein